MLSTLLTALSLALLASATPLQRRAGGPTPVPIPSNCTTINPLPHANCGTLNVSGYKVRENFTTAHGTYAAYYPGNGSYITQAGATAFCFEQCYGYSTLGSCKSALSAYNVPTPKGYYGTAGGVLETACLFFDEYLTPNDFVPAEQGQYLNATAIDIYCPGS